MAAAEDDDDDDTNANNDDGGVGVEEQDYGLQLSIFFVDPGRGRGDSRGSLKPLPEVRRYANADAGVSVSPAVFWDPGPACNARLDQWFTGVG